MIYHVLRPVLEKFEKICHNLPESTNKTRNLIIIYQYMRKIILTSAVSLACACLIFSCQEKIGEDKFPESESETEHSVYSVSGSVQKGPFSQGTSITIQALDDNLNPTGRNYSTTTYDDFGAFSIGSEIESRYVEIIADGFYYNEVAGSLSKSRITLRSISDLSEEGQTNINLLTTLESGRIRYLVSENAMSMSEARRQAEQELYDVFNIPLEVGDSGFDKADISKSGDGNAVLLAVSATLQSNRTEAELSELIAKISSEMQNTGTLGKSGLSEQVRLGGIGLDFEQIRSNLISRYEQLGQHGYEIPNFEDFMDINGNGVIDRDDQWLLVSDAQYQVPQSGGEYSVTVEYNVDYEVTVEDGCDWISVSSADATKAYLESTGYTVSVSENGSFESRSAGITFKSKESSQSVTVYVVQDGAMFSLGQIYYYLDNTAQVLEVWVTSSSDNYVVEIPESSDWIAESDSDSGVRKFAVEANNDFSSERIGSILFRDEAGNLLGEVTVNQDKAYMSIEQERFDIDNAAQNFILRISSSTEDYKVDVTEGSEWLAITSHSGGDWKFSTYLNSSYQPRDGMITVSDVSGTVLDTIPVNQWCETVTRVNVTPGSLESLIMEPGQQEYTETFIAEGEMNEYDFLLLRQMPRLKNIDISGLVNTTLPRSVFQKMYTLEKLSLPSNLVETPYSMCQGCYNLKEALPLPESVVVIGEEMFSGCSSLEGGLILHEGITTIGTGAFNGCSSLTGDLVIPSTVTFMGGYGYIFPGCEKIDKVYMKPTTPPATETGYDMFPNYRYLGVPVGSKELYEADEHYNKFMVIEEVDFEALGL